MTKLEGYGTVPRPRGAVRSTIERRIAAGEIEADPVQRDLADRLDRLEAALRETATASKKSALGWLFGRAAPREAPRGLYVFGKVGRGKSMLMDLFFAESGESAKRRVHFHAFMGDVHERIGRHREAVKAGRASGDDPIPPVAAEIAAEARLLCFDEFSVTDIADAMILSRLFDALFSRGVVLVATSNVAPDDLYRDGLNRPLFLPFVDMLKRRCEIFELDAPNDYRMSATRLRELYLTPLGLETDKQLDAIWTATLDGQAEGPETVTRKGRSIAVPRAGNGAARFEFADLLQRPLGAGDYLALAARYHTIVVDHVPVMGDAERNEAKRFITLIDTLYDSGRRIALSAEAPADELYRGRRGTEAFEFARTASRLHEMRSPDYLERAERRRGDEPSATASKDELPEGRATAEGYQKPQTVS